MESEREKGEVEGGVGVCGEVDWSEGMVGR